MAPPKVMGMGLTDLMEMIQGGRDPEHEAIINACTKMTDERLSAISGDNRLARHYVQGLSLIHI